MPVFKNAGTLYSTYFVKLGSKDSTNCKIVKGKTVCSRLIKIRYVTINKDRYVTTYTDTGKDEYIDEDKFNNNLKNRMYIHDGNIPFDHLKL